MSRSQEVAREQAHVAELYARLDELREQTRERLIQVRRQGASGTHQARSERDAFAGMYEARLAQLDAVEPGLCFGRLDMTAGERLHVGRIGLTDEGHDTMLVDWRAPAAEPFYRATPAESLGVVRRRHLRTRGRDVLDVEDDVFDVAELTDADRETLGGGGALLAALTESRTGRMRDIVATIQAEQDRVIRADPTGVLVVQGGPGTGKTAVALHRAAYLLYSHRERLARSGVLVVGPGPTFLRYIEQVLPSLGETGVLLSTLSSLLPGVTIGATESDEVARIKSDPRMADVIAAAVAARQRVPAEPVTIGVEDYDLAISPSEIAAARARTRRSRRRHNRARYAFAKGLLRTLMSRLAEQDPKLAAERAVVRSVMASEEFREIVDVCWPRLTMGELIEDMLTPAGLAQAGADGLLSQREQELLARVPGSPWTAADVPLLDEAWALLGDPEEVLRAAAERRRLRLEREYAQEFISASGMRGQVDVDALAERFGEGGMGGRSVAERAANDPDWQFGHVIVDEAQELSPMAWRMLVRRCPLRSMTVVGDVDQVASPWGTRRWTDTLEAVAPERWDLRELTVNYRTPSEIMAVAADVLAAVDPDAVPPSSVRDAGALPQAHQAAGGQLAATVVEVTAAARASIGDGRVAVLSSATDFTEVREALAEHFAGDVGVGASGLDSPIAVVEVSDAKGLEFDAVVLVQPESWLSTGERGLRELYVALTRATQRLDVVHTAPLPAVLCGLAAGGTGSASGPVSLVGAQQ